MSKFRVKLKIQSFDLEVEGTREDVPLIAQSIGNQIAGMLEPVAQIVEGEASVSPSLPKVLEMPQASKQIRRTRRSLSRKPAESRIEDQVIDWLHDPAKWGSPQQNWTTAAKAIWLLYVVGKETGQNELSGVSIAATFNKHFKQAKSIVAGNVNRDLGKLKVKANAPVAEDTTKTPTTWFLTQEGNKQAEDSILQARGSS